MPDTDSKRPAVVLAFDWGTHKIGVAVGQEVTGTATPLTPLAAVQGVPDWQEVEHLVATWRPGLFVVGIPLNMDGSESESSRRARRFARRLTGRFGIEWIGADERLTTAEARSAVGASTARPGSVDSIAAKLIAESWLRDRGADVAG